LPQDASYEIKIAWADKHRYGRLTVSDLLHISMGGIA
jgi:hypothetical protein